MLTLQNLKDMEPHTIIASGTGLIEHPWFNDELENLVNEKGEPDKNGKMVKVNWVAIRGGIYDWAIYHSLDANLEKADSLGGFEHLSASTERIIKGGAKLYKESYIRKFVPCTYEAFEIYRY